MPEGVKGGVVANPERMHAGAPLLHAASSPAAADVLARLRNDRRHHRRHIRHIPLQVTLARLRV